MCGGRESALPEQQTHTRIADDIAERVEEVVAGDVVEDQAHLLPGGFNRKRWDRRLCFHSEISIEKDEPRQVRARAPLAASEGSRVIWESCLYICVFLKPELHQPLDFSLPLRPLNRCDTCIPASGYF